MDNIFSQCDGFISHAIFGLLAIFDVRRRCVPPNDISGLIEYRVVAKEKPTKLAILTQQPLFRLKRHSP